MNHTIIVPQAALDIVQSIDYEEMLDVMEYKRQRANHFHRRAQAAESVLERLAFKLNAKGTSYQDLCEGIDARADREYWDGVRYPLWKRVVKFVQELIK